MVWSNPRYRLLRRALLVGLIIRLVLAPISSWTTDTTGFAQGELSFVFQGSPYLGQTLFNPPLAAFLQLPLVALLLVFWTPSQLLGYYPALIPSAGVIGPGFISPWLASPALLVALKLPLIAADVGTTLVLVFLAERAGFPSVAPWVGVAYFLNPLAIWVSALHAEPDGLAAFLVLLLVVALAYSRSFVAGLLLGLATFTKAYPIVLLPLAVVVLLTTVPRGVDGIGAIRRRIAGLVAGLALVTAIFLPYLAFLPAVIGRPVVLGDFGGLSLFVMYNSSSPPLFGFTGLWRHYLPGLTLLAALEVAAVVTAIGVALAVGWGIRRDAATSPAELLPRISIGAIATVSALLLAYPAPQPENVLAVVPLGLAAGLTLGRWARRCVWAISLAAFAQYMVYGTPLMGFTPLIVRLGPHATAFANTVFVRYAQGAYGAPPGYYWFAPGLVAGVAMYGLWLLAAQRALPSSVRAEVRRRLAGLRRH